MAHSTWFTVVAYDRNGHIYQSFSTQNKQKAEEKFLDWYATCQFIDFLKEEK